jgi:hypothetical protein
MWEEDMNLQTGDIVLLKRPKRKWYAFGWLFMKQFITFFFLKRGLIEAIDKYYHIEMVYGEGRDRLSTNPNVFTEEPPIATIMPLPKTLLKIFRLKNKPPDFNDKFYGYCQVKMNFPFDYKKFWQLFLDGVFGTDWFSRGKDNPEKDVCAENVSRFYKERIGVPCSWADPESSIPSDVNRYCVLHPELFELIIDEEEV